MMMMRLPHLCRENCGRWLPLPATAAVPIIKSVVRPEKRHNRLSERVVFLLWGKRRFVYHPRQIISRQKKGLHLYDVDWVDWQMFVDKSEHLACELISNIPFNVFVFLNLFAFRGITCTACTNERKSGVLRWIKDKVSDRWVKAIDKSSAERIHVWYARYPAI